MSQRFGWLVAGSLLSVYWCWAVLATAVFGQSPADPSRVATPSITVPSITAPAITVPSITVQVASGRTFTAVQDDRSDGATLWLRFGDAQAQLLRPIRWSSVTHITVDGQPQDIQAWRIATQAKAAEVQPQRRSERPAAPVRQPSLSPTRRLAGADSSRGEIRADFQFEPARGPSPDTGRAASPRVRSLAIDATAGNWDGDAETDGLIVYVQPLDELGLPVAAGGDVTFDLVGNHPSNLHRPEPLAPLARWTRRVRPAAVTARGALFKLEFQSLHPDFQTNVGPYALLHARLSVPGQGTFDETTAIRIRTYNPLRDQWQKSYGVRFHPLERLGRVQ